MTTIEERLAKAETMNGILSRTILVQQDSLELLYSRVLDLEKKIDNEILNRVKQDTESIIVKEN